MQHVALLGAGFSRNWGGWLATEILGELLGRLVAYPDIYQMLRSNTNFEDTLAELQVEANKSETSATKERLEVYETCLLETFSDMNQSFAELPGWHISNNAKYTTDAFLAKFDTIFTLNQDLLLELHYRGVTGGSSILYPRMQPPANWHNLTKPEILSASWQPRTDVTISGNCQPVIKLHGSVNWRDPEGNHLMVMGGGKQQTIERHPILQYYLDVFRDILSSSQVKLMVIGYGFNDSHINEILVKAGIDHDMKMHLVNPEGLDVLYAEPSETTYEPNSVHDIPLVGIAIRTLKESFLAEDKISLRSLYRFFE